MNVDTTTGSQCITFGQPTIFSSGVTNSGDVTVTKNDPTLCLKNNTAENGEGGADSSVQFIDHAGAVLGKVCTSHKGTADDTKGKMGFFTHNGTALVEAICIDDAQQTTLCADVFAKCDLTITGDLTVQGDTVTLNTSTLEVEDKNIFVAKGNTTTAGADGAGITIDSTTDISFQFEDTGDNWGSTENMNLANGKVYKINNAQVLSSTALASSVTSATGLTTMGGDLCVLDTTTNANPQFVLGATTNDALTITADTDASSKLVAVNIDTPSTGTMTCYHFLIDGTSEASVRTTGFDITAGDYTIANTSVLNATTLGTAVVTSSLTTVGALDSGSITENFGNIDNGVHKIQTGGCLVVDAHGTAKNAVGALTLGAGAKAGVWVQTETISSTNYDNLIIDNAAGRIGVKACSLELIDGGTDHNPFLQTGGTRICDFVKVQSVYDSGTASLNYALFETKSASASANKGKFVFSVDSTAVAGIEDSSITGCIASCGVKLENFTIEGGTF
jgi:hypothetical protein